MSSIYNNRSEPPTKGKVRKQHYTYLFPNPQSFNNNNNKCNNTLTVLTYHHIAIVALF